MRLKQYLVRRGLPELVGHELVGQAPFYILEDISVKDAREAAKNLQKECSQIVSVYKKRAGEQGATEYGSRQFLWRGVSQRNAILKKKSHLTDRSPMSTGKRMHDWMNDYFTDAFGWPVRNGVATSSSKSQAGTYGYPYVFFPPNNFEFVYSPDVWDLWSAVEKAMPFLNKQGNTLEIPPKYGPEKKQFQDKILPLFKSFTSGKGAVGNIHKAIESRNEIWFKVPYYYVVDASNRHGFGGFEIMQNLGLFEGAEPATETDPAAIPTFKMQGY